MSPETDLLTRLDHELGDLPAVPAGAYLLAGRRARRRRRVAAAAVAPAAAAAALALVAALGQGGSGREASLAEEPTAPVEVERPPVPDGLDADPDFVAPEPNNPVEAQDGLEGVDSYTTDDIPSWAQEYGSHGPVAIAPDGRLWVAPEATVRRVVVDPYPRGVDGVTASYAVEARCDCNPEEMPGGISWVIISTDGTGPGVGTMEAPGRETTDFELWVDDVTSFAQARPSFAERLVQFESDSSDVLVPASPGVTIVRQGHHTGYGDSFASRGTVAEVTYRDTTWYVMAVDPRDGAAWYDATSADLVGSMSAFVDSWHSS